MTIRQLNSEPIEHGGFYGCRVKLLGSTVRDSSYAIWTSDATMLNASESVWDLNSVEAIDDLIDLLQELREVDESSCK